MTDQEAWAPQLPPRPASVGARAEGAGLRSGKAGREWDRVHLQHGGKLTTVVGGADLVRPYRRRHRWDWVKTVERMKLGLGGGGAEMK